MLEAYVKQLPVTCSSALVFPRFSDFLDYLQLVSHYLYRIWQKEGKSFILP